MQINRETNGTVLAALWLSRRFDPKPSFRDSFDVESLDVECPDADELWVQGEVEVDEETVQQVESFLPPCVVA